MLLDRDHPSLSGEWGVCQASLYGLWSTHPTIDAVILDQTHEHEKSLTTLVLVTPNFAKPFVVEFYASRFKIEAVLMQEDHQIAFESQKLNKREAFKSTYLLTTRFSTLLPMHFERDVYIQQVLLLFRRHDLSGSLDSLEQF
jgi:hypothetical protein